MKKLLQVAAVVVLGAGLAGGAASAATGVIDGTGPDSAAVVSSDSNATHEVNNDVKAEFTNNNPQTALSGDATADDSNTAGDATSGVAGNDSTTAADLTVSHGANGAAGLNVDDEEENSGTISNTGPNSDSTVTSTSNTEVTVNNTTDLTVTNNNAQHAVSGVAVVSGNTEGGSATSGNATNTSNTSFTLNVSH